MAFINFLTRTEGPPALYLLRAYALTIAGAIVMIFITAPFVPAPEDADPVDPGASIIIILALIWPLLTTGLIAGGLTAAKRITPTYWHAAAATALALTAAFALLLNLAVAIVYLWPLFVYAVVFLAWELKSTLHAWAMATALHAAVNLGPALALV
ncbi:MAG: hypothetical protein AAFX03_03905 [Pseudomonadota bacterium]